SYVDPSPPCRWTPPAPAATASQHRHPYRCFRHTRHHRASAPEPAIRHASACLPTYSAAPMSCSLSKQTLSGVLRQAVQTSVGRVARSEEHTSELQSRENLVCSLLLEK